MLAKADLVTDMVGEFPELQGTMGRYYAQHDGEAPATSPTRSRSTTGRASRATRCPQAPVAQAVALADKLETLAGLFGIGALPTGDKDPFGLRRAALGVLRILIEKRLPLPLPSLLGARVPGVQRRGRRRSRVPEALADFLYDRLRGHLREQGYTANQVEAVLVAAAGAHRPRPRAAGGRQGVRGAAGSGRARRREQAHRQHPEEERRRGGRWRRRRAPHRGRGRRLQTDWLVVFILGDNIPLSARKVYL